MYATSLLGDIVLLIVASSAFGQEPPKKLPARAAEAQQRVEEHIRKLGGQGAQYIWKSETSLEKLFPESTFIVARFRQFPVARILPEGLRATNLFAVSHDGKLRALRERKDVETLFREKAIANVNDARLAMDAWLALSQEFHQDGMYRFEILSKAFAAAKSAQGLDVSGRAIVMQGGNGELAATLTFADGKLVGVKESAKIRPGPRPICQATRLLETDPIVRKIAEQDLLIMGLSAGAYLDEQRQTASPELRRAIDELWKRIQANGW